MLISLYIPFENSDGMAYDEGTLIVAKGKTQNSLRIMNRFHWTKGDARNTEQCRWVNRGNVSLLKTWAEID